MSKIRVFLFAAVLSLVAGLWLTPVSYSSQTLLRGSVTSPDGGPLEGIAVSARANGTTYTTTVFTDEEGKYYFPPMQRGHYQLWAQAVGFKTARAEIDLGAHPDLRQAFTLQTLEDFSRQLSGSEWIASLPEDTWEHRRMKVVFTNNCAGCHQPNFVLQNRFDEPGWRKIIDVMETIGIYGNPPRPDRPPYPLLRYFKEDLAAYLAKMRGPSPSPLKLKRFPRPRGEAARVVITEYDITSSSDTDKFVTHDGSDWMEGTPSVYEARGPHDAEVDANGFVWIADSQTDRVRTVVRLDPRTGQVKNYKLEGRNGTAMRSHGIIIDRKGIAWFNADGGLGKINTKTDKIEYFEPPEDMPLVGGTLDVHPDGVDGIIWASSPEGALAFDPSTNKFTNFPSISRGHQGRTYGVAVDVEGNGWWAQMNYDKVGKGNYRTGEITEVEFEPVPGRDEIVTAQDREIYKLAGSDWNTATPWQQAPRRLGGDRKGNMWVALWWGNRLAKIDIKTHKITYYPYPHAGYPGVYDTVVDKNGMVWINLMNADRIARFDPETEEWVDYQLPTLGAETRHISVDNRKDQVEVWTPYWRTSRIARLQFRPEKRMQELARR